jgi:hypothetical protein
MMDNSDWLSWLLLQHNLWQRRLLGNTVTLPFGHLAVFDVFRRDWACKKIMQTERR